MENTLSQRIQSHPWEYILFTKYHEICGTTYKEYYRIFSKVKLDLHQCRDLVRHVIRAPYRCHSKYGMLMLNGRFPGIVDGIIENHNFDIYPCLEKLN